MTLYTNIESNKRRSVLLLGLFLLIVIGLGWLISEVYHSPIILYLAVAISLIQAYLSYYSGDKIALAVSGAREISEKDDTRLWHVVENLCITAGLPMPKLYIINDPAPNAFATGRDPKHSSLAVTSGLLIMMDKPELEGVIAHELSHIGNYDILVMMIVVVLVSVIAIVSDLFLRLRFFGFGDDDNNSGGNGIILIISILVALLAPLIAMLVQLAVSRRREFLADSSGALLTRYPEGLIRALEKIGSYSLPMRKFSSSTAHLFISSPFGKTKKSISISNLFSTHPPIEERVKALNGMNI